MTKVVRKWVSIGLVAFATLAQLIFAGVACWTRGAAQRDADNERAATENYAAHLAAAVERSSTSPDARVPHATLLPSADVAGTLCALQTLSDSVGVTMVSANASQSNTVGRQAFVIAGRGTPEQLCAFVAGLEQHERLIVIENGKITPGTADEVNFELGLSTYHAGGGK